MRVHLPLRARTMAGFGLVSLAVAALVGGVAYGLTRATLIDQRERVAERQTYVNARSVRSVIEGAPGSAVDGAEALERVQPSSEGVALLRVGDDWYSTSVSAGRDVVPASLLDGLDEGGAARQRIELDGGTAVAVAVPLSTDDATYVELLPFGEVDVTLDRVARGLVVAVVVATGAGIAAGLWLSRRALRPVRRTAEAARQIRQGSLDRRLGEEDDADLRPLVESFNGMVDELQARIEREARFASDVGHELRGPLATMGAAVALARRRTTDPGALEALDTLEGEVHHYQDLVTDLLEIARSEAGVAELVRSEVDPVELARQVLASTGRDDVEVEATHEGHRPAHLDKRRVGQALVNLLDNADRHGGGVVRVSVDGDDDQVSFCVDDDGPGIPQHERAHVLRRFARGASSGPGGTGLGLALVVEHVRLHGGRIDLGEAPGGGTRATLVLPRDEEGAP